MTVLPGSEKDFIQYGASWLEHVSQLIVSQGGTASTEISFFPEVARPYVVVKSGKLDFGYENTSFSFEGGMQFFSQPFGLTGLGADYYLFWRLKGKNTSETLFNDPASHENLETTCAELAADTLEAFAKVDKMQLSYTSTNPTRTSTCFQRRGIPCNEYSFLPMLFGTNYRVYVEDRKIGNFSFSTYGKSMEASVLLKAPPLYLGKRELANFRYKQSAIRHLENKYDLQASDAQFMVDQIDTSAAKNVFGFKNNLPRSVFTRLGSLAVPPEARKILFEDFGKAHTKIYLGTRFQAFAVTQSI